MFLRQQGPATESGHRMGKMDRTRVHVNTGPKCPLSVHRLRPHPLRELGVQTVEDLRGLDPVDDAADVIAVRVHGGEAPVVRSPVMWLRTHEKKTTKTKKQ